MSARPPLPVDLWDSLSPEARALILTLQSDAAELRANARALQQQVHDLQERLNQNSTHPSRPPSPDLFTMKRRPRERLRGVNQAASPGMRGGSGPSSPPIPLRFSSPRSAAGAA